MLYKDKQKDIKILMEIASIAAEYHNQIFPRLCSQKVFRNEPKLKFIFVIY